MGYDFSLPIGQAFDFPRWSAWRAFRGITWNVEYSYIHPLVNIAEQLKQLEIYLCYPHVDFRESKRVEPEVSNSSPTHKWTWDEQMTQRLTSRTRRAPISGTVIYSQMTIVSHIIQSHIIQIFPQHRAHVTSTISAWGWSNHSLTVICITLTFCKGHRMSLSIGRSSQRHSFFIEINQNSPEYIDLPVHPFSVPLWL